ncbi:hypothetical protein ES695_13645 [Candidatus Atribacteria bacterium 1244-E10-H5-B2]|nr:MAG: hypothetical protein ES695_13645 [Candidatus Atribacteria bacterium 1244-E10-H5-B2]
MKIDITEIDLIQFVKEVYKLSIPAGLGRLHFKEGGLTDEDAKGILDIWKNDKQFALDMDYVGGRACKMTVFRDRNRIYIRSPWYDHTDMRLTMLLKAIWPEDKPFPELKAEEHGIACHCMHCQIKRRIQV